MSPAAKHWSMIASAGSAMVGTGGGGGAARRHGDLERDQGERAGVGLGRGEDVLVFAKNIAQIVDGR